MSHWIGEVRNEAAIPRVLFKRASDEGHKAYIQRLAQAISFAFLMDPRQADEQPDLDIESDMIVLPDGLVARTRTKGVLELTRDQARVVASGADQLVVFLFEQGSADARPTRTGARLRAGDIVVFDLAETCALTQYDCKVIRLIVARAMLPEAVRGLALNGCVIPAGHGLAGVLTSSAGRLMDDSPRMSAQHGASVLRAILDLLGLAIEDRLTARDAQLPIKTLVQTLIDNNLEREDLTPAWIADQLGVSRATLYRAFQPYGGVREFILRRRLQRAWTLIGSEGGPSPAEVADACGFGGRAKLAKSFQETLGLSLDDIYRADAKRRSELGRLFTDEMLRGWERRFGRKNTIDGPGADLG